MACLVLVVQHGEKARVPGDPGLTAAGRQQAAATASWLRSTHSVSRVVTSPLRRAVETAEPIGRCFGLEVSADDRLRERMNWEGGAGQTLEAFSAEWRRTSGDRSYVPQSGDSSEQAADRFLTALDGLAGAAGDDDEMVVVTHGGVTVDALRTLLGDAPLRAQRPTLIDDGVPCCAITELRRAGGTWTVGLPSTEHLDRLRVP